MQTLVNARSKDGRTLRRHVLKDSWVVFITAGYSGKRFIFEKVAHNPPIILALTYFVAVLKFLEVGTAAAAFLRCLCSSLAATASKRCRRVC